MMEGTTATIAIPINFEVGYGRAWAGAPAGTPPNYDPVSAVEDLQRGELIFTLYDGSTEVAKLPVLFITRIARDPASSQFSHYHEDVFQPVAFVNIPQGLAEPGVIEEYEIEIRRWRRDLDEGPNVFTPVTPDLNWVGWGKTDPGPTTQRIPIEVVGSPDGVDRYTPVEGWGLNLGQVQTGPFVPITIDLTVPRPEFRIQVPNSVQQPPYAWEMDVEYPNERMQVVDVRLIRGNPAGGHVAWSATPPPTSDCTANPPTKGTLKLHVADPQGYSRGVAVVFALINQNQPACRKRIESADLQIVSGTPRAYNISGGTISAANLQIVQADLR